MKLFTDKIIDSHIPFTGQCGFCGYHDSRHRIFDAIIDRLETSENLADDYELPIEIIKKIRELRPYRYKRRTA